MPRRTHQRRDAARAASARASRPAVESLEDRQLLSTVSGGKWTYGSRITYSFVPDGTSIGGIPSNLFQTLNSKFSTAAWVQAFTKAAAIWQQVANVNLALVPDDGSPIDTPGNQQGDSRFGDIRIGAYPQSDGQLGIAIMPPPINGGAAAGDIFINSKISWKLNNDYDLQTVAIHEIGHALGLGHSAIQTAVMYDTYTWMKQTLTADDTAGLASIYGAVPGEATSNNTASTATVMTPAAGQNQVVLGSQFINTGTDLDWFKVTVPSTTSGKMVVAMQTSALSSLSPRLAVYNAAQASLGQSTATNVYGTTVYFTVNNVSPGQVYYVRASAGNTGPGSTGGYGLSVNFGAGTQATVAPPYTAVAEQADKGYYSDAAMKTASPAGGLAVKLGLGKLLGLGLSLSHGIGLDVDLLGIDLHVKVQIGNMSVYAEPLTVGKGAKPHGPRRHLGRGGLPRIHNGQFTIRPNGLHHRKP